MQSEDPIDPALIVRGCLRERVGLGLRALASHRVFLDGQSLDY